MDNQDRRTKSPTVSSPPKLTVPDDIDSGEHISLSPPVKSPAISQADSCSSPLHSKQYSEDHISLSPSSSVSSLHNNITHSHVSSPENEKIQSRPSPAIVNKDVFREPVESRVILEESMAIVKVTEFEEPKAVPEKTDLGRVDAVEGRVNPALRRGKRLDKMLKKAALGFRVFGFLFCLLSFSVMAADRNQGWAIDSFERYIEFRYCMSVNVIGFVYSGAQAIDLWYKLASGKYIVQQKQRHYLDFAFDQIIAYLLISASSSAAIRIDDWELNWGKEDKFPDMATASISMSFLAFVALAFTSLISGYYALCTSKSL